MNQLVSLVDLAGAINALHEQAEQSAHQALDRARQAGELLLQAKELVEHGQWLPWLKDNCRLAERTAQAYMRLARDWSKLEAKSATVADLTVREAVRQLSASARNLSRPDARGIEYAEQIIDSGYAQERLNSAVIKIRREADEQARESQRRARAEQLAASAPIHVEGRAVTVAHFDKNTWCVRFGPNETGRKFSPEHWYHAAHEAADSALELGPLREAHEQARAEVARLESELQQAIERRTEASRALSWAAYQKLEREHGQACWNTDALYDVAPAISDALRTRSPEELADWADAFWDPEVWEWLLEELERDEPKSLPRDRPRRNGGGVQSDIAYDCMRMWANSKETA